MHYGDCDSKFYEDSEPRTRGNTVEGRCEAGYPHQCSREATCQAEGVKFCTEHGRGFDATALDGDSLS